ncbi:hypothetical protein Hdeb2414_s0016g00484471 [Helianthus debilis subsp. tardiflorus]
MLGLNLPSGIFCPIFFVPYVLCGPQLRIQCGKIHDYTPSSNRVPHQLATPIVYKTPRMSMK